MKNLIYVIIRLFAAYQLVQIAMTAVAMLSYGPVNSGFYSLAVLLVPAALLWFGAEWLTKWFTLESESTPAPVGISYEQLQTLGLQLLGLFVAFQGISRLAPALVTLAAEMGSVYTPPSSGKLLAESAGPVITILIGLLMTFKPSLLARSIRNAGRAS